MTPLVRILYYLRFNEEMLKARQNRITNGSVAAMFIPYSERDNLFFWKEALKYAKEKKIKRKILNHLLFWYYTEKGNSFKQFVRYYYYKLRSKLGI